MARCSPAPWCFVWGKGTTGGWAVTNASDPWMILVCGPLLFRQISTSLQNVFGVAYVKRPFQGNSCIPESGSSGDNNRDNQVFFLPGQGEDMSFSFAFEANWYAVSVGQPVASDCLKIDSDGGSLAFTAGRSNSQEAAFVFMEGNSVNSVVGAQAFDSDSNLLAMAFPGVLFISGSSLSNINLELGVLP